MNADDFDKMNRKQITERKFHEFSPISHFASKQENMNFPSDKNITFLIDFPRFSRFSNLALGELII